jgi:glycosyltransferase involved in cell wall biosynthesis
MDYSAETYLPKKRKTSVMITEPEVLSSSGFSGKGNLGEPRVLFVTRKTKETEGGMQRASASLYRELAKISNVDMLVLPEDPASLLLSLPRILIKGLMKRRAYDVVYLQDGLLSVLGAFWRAMGTKVVITVHGLDVTYPHPIYQRIVPRLISRHDAVVCVSQATKAECESRGIEEGKIKVIGNGVSDDYSHYCNSSDRGDLKICIENHFGIDIKGKKILLSVGRLVERKGFHWFIENVFEEATKGRDDVCYLIVGDGPMKERIERSIASLGPAGRNIHALGFVDEEWLKRFYAISDIFVLPNIKVSGDMEGFGIVGLEAASANLPIIATEIEGMTDFLKNDVNSFMIPEGDASQFANRLAMLIDEERLRKKIAENAKDMVSRQYTWGNISAHYMTLFCQVADGRK